MLLCVRVKVVVLPVTGQKFLCVRSDRWIGCSFSTGARWFFKGFRGRVKVLESVQAVRDGKM